MNWIELNDEQQLAAIKAQSKEQPVIIFKHSTRCSISTMAKGRLERSEAPAGVAFYYLDLIRYRSVSNAIADLFGVPHESPQVLLIRNEACTYNESHNGISMDEIISRSAA